MLDKFQMMESILQLLDTISVKGAKDVLTMGEVFKMLSALQNGIKNEDETKKKQIDGLTETIRKLQQPQIDDGGDVVGGEHYDINFNDSERNKTQS